MRFLLITMLFFVTACSTGPERRTNSAAGPLGPAARNKMVQKSPEALLATAYGLERGGDLSAALALYSQLRAEYPDNKTAIQGEARIFVLTGRGDVGINQLLQLHGLYPADQALQTDLVNSYIHLGYVERARDFLRGLQSGGILGDTQKVRLGVLEEVTGDAQRARLLWDEVQTSKPDNFETQQFLALSFALDGAYETATALLQQGLDRPSTAQDAKDMLAYIYALSGQWQTAEAIAQTVLSPEELAARRPVYQMLPRLRRAEQARAIMLGQITQEALETLRKD